MDRLNSNLYKKLDISDLFFDQEQALDPKWVDHPLESSEHQGLYNYFQQGSRICHRCNSLGQLELFTFIKDIEAHDLFEAPLGIQIE